MGASNPGDLYMGDFPLVSAMLDGIGWTWLSFAHHDLVWVVFYWNWVLDQRRKFNPTNIQVDKKRSGAVNNSLLKSKCTKHTTATQRNGNHLEHCYTG